MGHHGEYNEGRLGFRFTGPPEFDATLNIVDFCHGVFFIPDVHKLNKCKTEGKYFFTQVGMINLN